MEIDDEIVISLRGELADDPADQRHAVDRNCCLGAEIGEGAQAGTEPGRENQGAHESKSMSGPLRPNLSRRCKNRLR